MAIAEGVPGHDWVEASIRGNTLASSGVYAIYNRAWVYIGESNDIQHSLLEHWGGDNACIASAVPTGFVFELCDLAERQRRCVTLIGRFRPRCNQGAATTRR
jgi:hypothetical protein